MTDALYPPNGLPHAAAPILTGVPAVRVRNLLQADPMLTLGLMSVLTAEQWRSILDGRAYAVLLDAVLIKVRAALRKYPIPVEHYAEDVAGDVLVRLCDGAFLNAYRPDRTHPAPYLLGCAHNLARVAARSIWRRRRRERDSLDTAA